MGRFHNIWGPEHHSGAMACDYCGAVVYTASEAFDHKCPGIELPKVETEIKAEDKPRPEFPWLRMFALLALLAVIGGLLCWLR